mmetsp:Transcript_41333/g.68521  ORF Transcript_41333/g.68521 Transcript_41333/m.68521 type:complete len:274 (+) Transcript_41333:250-1071(+)
MALPLRSSLEKNLQRCLVVRLMRVIECRAAQVIRLARVCSAIQEPRTDGCASLCSCPMQRCPLIFTSVNRLPTVALHSCNGRDVHGGNVAVVTPCFSGHSGERSWCGSRSNCSLRLTDIVSWRLLVGCICSSKVEHRHGTCGRSSRAARSRRFRLSMDLWGRRSTAQSLSSLFQHLQGAARGASLCSLVCIVQWSQTLLVDTEWVGIRFEELQADVGVILCGRPMEDCPHREFALRMYGAPAMTLDVGDRFRINLWNSIDPPRHILRGRCCCR